MNSFFFDNNSLRAFTLLDFVAGIEDCVKQGYTVIPGTAHKAGERYMVMFEESTTDIFSEDSTLETTQGTPPSLEEPSQTREEELQLVFQEKGIKGLREIATPLGVKGVASETIIKDILEKEEKTQQ